MQLGWLKFRTWLSPDVSRMAEGSKRPGGSGRFRGARGRRNGRRSVGSAQSSEGLDCAMSRRRDGPGETWARGGLTRHAPQQQKDARPGGASEGHGALASTAEGRGGASSSFPWSSLSFLPQLYAIYTSLMRVEDLAGFPKSSKLQSEINLHFLFPQGWKFFWLYNPTPLIVHWHPGTSSYVFPSWISEDPPNTRTTWVCKWGVIGG